MANLEEVQKIHPMTGEQGTFYIITCDDGSDVGTTWDQHEAVRLMRRAQRLDKMKATEEQPEEPKPEKKPELASPGLPKREPSEPEPPMEKAAEPVGGRPIYDYVESRDPYYTIEMFIEDTGEDHEQIWKESFIDKSTNFLEKAKPTATETPDKEDKGPAHGLYAKARAHGDAIAHTAAADIKAKADELIATLNATKEQRVAEEKDKYVEENTLTHDEAIEIVTKENEEKVKAAAEANQAQIKADDEKKKAENDAQRQQEDATREGQLQDSFDSGDKHCADGPDKVVSLVNNTVTDFIKKTALQEVNRVKTEKDNIDAYVEAKAKELGEKEVTEKNTKILEAARNEVAMENKAKEKANTDAFQSMKTALLKIFGQIGL